MANLPQVRNTPVVFLICDSRGRGLQNEFPDTDHNITVKSYSGAKLYRSTKMAEGEIIKRQPDQIYILSGINTITQLNRVTREVSLISMDKSKIIQQYKDEMNFSLIHLKKITKKDTKIVFAPITGMDMAKYNKVDQRSLVEAQNMLNEAAMEINNLIIAQNTSCACKTPWTHSIVHRYFRGKYHFTYDRLEEDGCHLTDQIRKFWAKKIISAIISNI